MAMPSPRRITVDEQEYPYLIRSEEDPRLMGWSSKEVRLIVELPTGKRITRKFSSKAWTSEHEHNTDSAPAHINAFTPKDVASVIRALTFNSAGVPSKIELPNWREIS